MTYKNVLKKHLPSEEGDFLFRYEIGEKTYIVYSPTSKEVNCLETNSFTDLSPLELAHNINREFIPEDESAKEFDFEYHSSKEDIIKFLFDIETNMTENLKGCRVADQKGYLLKDLSSPYKVRNFFQFDKNNDCKLSFENRNCLLGINEEYPSDSISLTWNPYLFYRLETTEDKIPSYLLASSSPGVCAYILNIMEEKKYVRMNLYVDKNITDAMFFCMAYINKHAGAEIISSSLEGLERTIVLKEWNPIKVLGLVMKAQNSCNTYLKRKYNDPEAKDYKMYTCLSFDSNSFIVFRDDPLYTLFILKAILTEISCEEICLLCDPYNN